MEIRNQPHDSGVQPKSSAAEPHVVPLGPASGTGSEAVRAGRGSAPRAESDRLELSERSRRLAAEGSDAGARASSAEEARRERVRELKAAYEAGDLNTPERIEQSARRLLGGS